MLKNIKLFSTDSDRTTYESSASYETPYVSKVTADNSVHYNKVVQLITFTIASVPYQAIEGMTWREWVESEYNTGGFEIRNTAIYFQNSAYYHVEEPYSWTGSFKYVTQTDIIVNNGDYVKSNAPL